jgi:hypothetical protein
MRGGLFTIVVVMAVWAVGEILAFRVARLGARRGQPPSPHWRTAWCTHSASSGNQGRDGGGRQGGGGRAVPRRKSGRPAPPVEWSVTRVKGAPSRVLLRDAKAEGRTPTHYLYSAALQVRAVVGRMS